MHIKYMSNSEQFTQFVTQMTILLLSRLKWQDISVLDNGFRSKFFYYKPREANTLAAPIIMIILVPFIYFYFRE